VASLSTLTRLFAVDPAYRTAVAQDEDFAPLHSDRIFRALDDAAPDEE